MSDLDGLKDRLSAILYKRYELKGLTERQAKQAILEPAALSQKENDFISPTFTYTDAALTKIIKELATPSSVGGSRDGAGGIEAFQLQILCQYIENEVIKGRILHRNNNGTPDVYAEDLPDITNVYEAYYHSQLDQLDPNEHEVARELIEYGLIYEDTQKEEARRLSVDADLLVQQFATQGATHALLKKLENTFLLRREMNTLGGYNYELSHDTLIAPVLKAKAEREAERESLAAERRAQEAEAKAREERSKRRRANLLSAITVFGLIVALWQSWVANNAKQFAEQAQQEAIIQKTEAERNLKALTDRRIQELIQNAETYVRSGDLPLAIRDLQVALALDPTRTDIKQRIKQLNY